VSADLNEGMTWGKDGKANLQATTTAHMGNFASETLNLTVTMGSTTWDSIAPGRTVTSMSASTSGGTVSVSISETNGSVLSSFQATFLGFCSVSFSHFNRMGVIPQTQSLVESYDLSFLVAPPPFQCSFVPGATTRVVWDNYAKVAGKMHHTNVVVEGTSFDAIFTNAFGEGTFSDGIPTPGFQFVTYVTYEKDSGGKDCYVCRISASSSSASGSIYYTFYGSIPSLVSESFGGPFTSIGCQTSTVCITPKSDSDNICLSRNTKVLMSSGVDKSIIDANIGDHIMVGKMSGGVDVAPIAYIPHKQNNKTAGFVNIMIGNGEKQRVALSVTPGHFVVVSKQCNTEGIDMLRGEDVSAGMCLVNNQDTLVEVTRVSRSVEQGVYTVVADHPDGIIIANGFKVSSFGENHGVVNTYYHMHRFFSRHLPKWMMESSTLRSLNHFVGDLALYFA